MKIVKEFEDNEFLDEPRMSSKPRNHNEYKWMWGLGDDGKVYFKCTRFSSPDKWQSLSDYELIAACVSLKYMKRIVKEFGHLLVFL